jgi:hypothetical protein
MLAFEFPAARQVEKLLRLVEEPAPKGLGQMKS